ncbi:MAG: hypothetical protein ACFFG0_22825 [Candidatus Thorarchaeota archaeon]
MSQAILLLYMLKASCLKKSTQICYGNAVQVFNPLNDHYLFESLYQKGVITYIYLEICNHVNLKIKFFYKLLRKFVYKFKKKSKTNGVWFKLAFEEYFPSKGPPMST